MQREQRPAALGLGEGRASPARRGRGEELGARRSLARRLLLFFLALDGKTQARNLAEQRLSRQAREGDEVLDGVERLHEGRGAWPRAPGCRSRGRRHGGSRDLAGLHEEDGGGGRSG